MLFLFKSCPSLLLPEKHEEFIDSSSNFNWYNRSWCRNLSLAFKHEPVHFLVSKNLVINHLLLEALPAVQTAITTARLWSLFAFVPYAVSPGQEEKLQSLSYET